MERAISPPPSSSLEGGKPTSASNPQRSLVAERRTSYRLFPVVDATPPASPVSLQRASLSKAVGNHRRRSSSLEQHQHHGRRDYSSAATGHATLSTNALRRKNHDALSRKVSLPDIRPLRAAPELDNDVSAKPRDLPPRPHTSLDRALGGSVGSVTREASLGDCQERTRRKDDGDCASAHDRGLVRFPSTRGFGQRRGMRSRPDLRIAVAANHGNNECPPPPPPKSPRHARDNSAESQQQNSPQRHYTTTTGHTRDDSDPPVTPSIAQKQSLVSLSPTLKVREFTVSPARGRIPRKEVPKKMYDLLPSDFLEKPLPPIGPTLQLPPSKFSDPARPSTSDGSGAASSSVWSSSSVSLPQRQPHSRPVESTFLDQVNSSLGHSMISESTSRHGQQHDLVRPSSPAVQPLSSHPVKADWDELMSSSRPAWQSVTPEPQVSRPDTSSRGRPVINHLSKEPQSREQILTDYMPPEQLSKASLALAAARANVAALNASTGSPGSERRSRSSGSDTASLSRHPPDILPRRPSSPGATDPVETLKNLSEQVEALHTRYASLKAERQKISSAIITRLKEKKLDVESLGMILDEQLSLAAVSSSMDICFAKLKSLECRKEDAIAALIAKTSQAQRNPSDNISAMIASMALSRKASLARSGRSTPDPGEHSSTNRLTQPSTRTLSYTSEPESFSYRTSSLSRKQSQGGESVVYTDGFERPTETIPEGSESPRSQRVSRIHESASLMEQRTSEVSALSPVPENPHRTSLSEAVLETSERSSDTAKGNERALSPSSGRSVSPDDLLDGRKVRMNGSKAAKILGFLGKSANGKDSPSIRLPDDRKIPLKATEVEIELRSASTSESLDETNASPLSVRTKDTDGSVLATDTPVSPQDLETQLKSFPKPNQNTLSTHSSTDTVPGRRDTGGSFLTNGSSADEPDESETSPVPPARAPEPKSKKSRMDTKKHNPSAHTIQVYLEPDEILEYYHRIERR